MLHRLRRKQPGAGLLSLLFYACWRATLKGLFVLVYRARGEGLHNVPAEGAALLVANHQSNLDPPAIGSLITCRHLDFLAKAELFRVPVLGPVIRALNSVPVRRNGADAGSMKEILGRLQQGRATLIFPEGQRTLDGKLGPFQRGVLLLINRAKCPVVPVAIDGPFEAWPRTRRFPRVLGVRVRVRYGAPIPYDDLMRDGPDAALVRLRAEVAALLAEIRHQRADDVVREGGHEGAAQPAP